MPLLALAGLAASAASTGIAASQAAQGSGDVGTTTIPQTPRSRAIQHILSRALVQNLGAVSPSFGEYTESGGKALFPFMFNVAPKEASQLGFFTKTGKKIPFVDPTAGTLTPEQTLFLAQQEAATVGATGPLVRLGRLQNKIEHRELRGKATTELVKQRDKAFDRLPTIGQNREDISPVDDLNALLLAIDEGGKLKHEQDPF